MIRMMRSRMRWDEMMGRCLVTCSITRTMYCMDWPVLVFTVPWTIPSSSIWPYFLPPSPCRDAAMPPLHEFLAGCASIYSKERSSTRIEGRRENEAPMSERSPGRRRQDWRGEIGQRRAAKEEQHIDGDAPVRSWPERPWRFATLGLVLSALFVRRSLSRSTPWREMRLSFAPSGARSAGTVSTVPVPYCPVQHCPVPQVRYYCPVQATDFAGLPTCLGHGPHPASSNPFFPIMTAQ
jgi:hypothetical protein